MTEHPGDGSTHRSVDDPRSPDTGPGDGTASERAERAGAARQERTEDEQRAADGWGRQPMASYEAGDSGGWGGPVHQALTGPLPRLRYEASESEKGAARGGGGVTAAADRETVRSRERSAPEAGVAPGAVPGASTQTGDWGDVDHTGPTGIGTIRDDTDHLDHGGPTGTTTLGDDTGQSHGTAVATLGGDSGDSGDSGDTGDTGAAGYPGVERDADIAAPQPRTGVTGSSRGPTGPARGAAPDLPTGAGRVAFDLHPAHDEPPAFEPAGEAEEIHRTGIAHPDAPQRSEPAVRADDPEPTRPAGVERHEPGSRGDGSVGNAGSGSGARVTSGMHAVTPVAAAVAPPAPGDEEPTTAVHPPVAGRPRRGFARRVTLSLAPIAFWLVVTWLALDYVRGIYALSTMAAQGVPTDLGGLLVELVAGLFRVVALACLARVLLEACAHLAELAASRRPQADGSSEKP